LTFDILDLIVDQYKFQDILLLIHICLRRLLSPMTELNENEKLLLLSSCSHPITSIENLLKADGIEVQLKMMIIYGIYYLFTAVHSFN
jgi:hypothetical protein